MKKIIAIFSLLVILVSGVPSKVFAQNSEKVIPKVSVVVPVYNAEKYLKECLDSLVNQTLKDIEIICVNDGSTDNSLEILNEYANKNHRVRVIDQKNQGACIARNKGLSVALGEYIAFVDSDDYLELDAYEQAYKEAKSKNLDILSFGWRGVPQETNWDKYKSSPKEKLFINDSVNAWFYCGIGANVNIWNKLYKRSFLEESGVHFIEDLPCAQDLCFNILLFPRAKNIEFIPNKYYNYRRDSSGNITSKNKGASRIATHIRIIKMAIKDWSENGYLKSYELRMLRLLLSWNIGTITGISDDMRSTCAKDLLSSLNPLYKDREGDIKDKITITCLEKLKSFIK